MNVNVIIERHDDGFVAYPVGLKGAVVADGDTYEEALANLKSAIAFHIVSFGFEQLELEDSAKQVFVVETAIAV